MCSSKKGIRGLKIEKLVFKSSENQFLYRSQDLILGKPLLLYEESWGGVVAIEFQEHLFQAMPTSVQGIPFWSCTYAICLFPCLCVSSVLQTLRGSKDFVSDFLLLLFCLLFCCCYCFWLFWVLFVCFEIRFLCALTVLEMDL